MNICIEYLYRDADNYKNWGRFVCQNSNDTPIAELISSFRETLIDGEFFVAEDVGIPILYFNHFDPNSGHGWHEFHDIYPVDDAAEGRDISAILALLAKSSKKVAH